MDRIAALATGGLGVDLRADAPWLAMLVLLVGGVLLPAGLYALFDRWVAGRLRIDPVALATRYGGFMNSWAVFGRHASEYRDLRPIFPTAQAAEFARFDDGTATIAARFQHAAAASGAAAETFGSFAAEGIEYADPGLSFRTGQTGRGYACGQWLVIGDTLFVFYGGNSNALERRRQATPALRVRRFPGILRLLHNRIGHGILTTLWIVTCVAGATVLLEAGGSLAPRQARPMEVSDLRIRIASARIDGMQVMVLPVDDGRRILVTLPPNDLRNADQGSLAGRNWVTAVEMQFDTRRSIVNIMLLAGKVREAELAGENTLPDRWWNTSLLREPGDRVEAALRSLVLKSGWTWQPRLWPWQVLWRDPWHPWRG